MTRPNLVAAVAATCEANLPRRFTDGSRYSLHNYGTTRVHLDSGSLTRLIDELATTYQGSDTLASDALSDLARRIHDWAAGITS